MPAPTPTTVPAPCPRCRGSRYLLTVAPAMTALLGAGMDFAREVCPACDGEGSTEIDPLDPAYFAPLPVNHDMIRGCVEAAVSGEIFCGPGE